MNKRILASILGVFVLALLVTASPAMAAEVNVTGTNEETGFDSDNDNDFDVDNDREVDVENDGDVDNNATVTGNSGDNEQNKNTQGGDLESGVVDVTGEWNNTINRFALCDCLLGEDGLVVTAEFLNATTGAKSDNDNDLYVDNDVDVDVDNDADIDNMLRALLNTGRNEQNKNTEAGDTNTGDALFGFMIANWANNSTGSDNGGGPEVEVDVVASNTVTGFDSDNSNDVDVDNDYEVDVDNDANINNDVRANVNTGRNEQNKNTQGGDLNTGDGEVLILIENNANNSECCVVKGGDLTVTAELENSTTGAKSDNENIVDVDNEVDVDVNNDADINNNVNANVNTGRNEQNKNTQAGSTQTGNVTIDLSIFNEVNSSN